jgi:acetolactate synthase regulatory subunit
MIIHLNISISNAEGALIRILGTIGRRGHKLLGLRSRIADPGDDFQKLLVDIDCGERSPDVLIRQIDRLHDVLSISRFNRSAVEVDRQNLSFQSALPSRSGITESTRRAPHG